MNKNFNNNRTNNNSNNNNFGGIVMMNGTITTKKDFVETIKAAMETMYSEGYVVRVQDVQKNNGMVLCGLTIQKIGVNIAPTIYLDSFYEEYRNGRTLVSIVNTISATYEQHKVEKNLSVDALSSFDSVKDKICFKLINAEKNQELLQDVPYVSFMDLAIVFYILVDQSVDGNATALVRNGMMQLWGNPDVDDIYKIAKMNTQRLFRGHVASINHDSRDEMEGYREIIKENIDCNSLLMAHPYDQEMVEGIYELILETVLSKNEEITIAGDVYPNNLVKSKFLKLNYSHVEYVIACLEKNTTKVRNIKSYLLASLFNAGSTISSYYRAEVNHDMPQFAG